MRRHYILSILTALATALGCHAMTPDHYAGQSVLAEGSWARVSVSETGMHLVTTAMLRSMGFSDPARVRVYGYGGRMLSEELDASNPDDLPMVPSVQTSQGIVFFAFDNVRWTQNGSTGNTEYIHVLNPYSDVSYYFLSDREAEDAALPETGAPAAGDPVTSYICRMVHESDQEAPANTGRLLLGEDFRTKNSQTFAFELPDNTGEPVTLHTRFGAKLTNGQGSLMFTANGEQLPSTGSDQIKAATSSSVLVTLANSYKTVEDAGDRLNLGITFTSSGALQTARLDFIRVEYTRALRLNGGELYFYGQLPAGASYEIDGCDAETVIWDISDPIAPAAVSFTLDGAKARFAPGASGYREYVAFTPSAVKRPVAQPRKIANQNIHALPAPGMLVISPEEYLSAANRISELHAATDGLTVTVLTPEQIYNEFSSGVPELTAFRKLLKMWYDRAAASDSLDHTRYCIIMSRPSYDNKGVSQRVKSAAYPRLPIWQSENSTSATLSYSTDDYVGMLQDNNSRFDISRQTIQTAVARMPVKSLQEANIMLDKLEKYMLTPELGPWRSNMMLIADDQNNGVHMTQAEDVIKQLYSTEDGQGYITERLYMDAYQLTYSGSGPQYPEAKARMLEKIDEGLAYIDYIGHASPRGWTHENMFNWTDITTMTNKRLPYIYAATCEFMRWDDDAVSGAEEMWLNPDAGVIGMICPSREVLIGSNGTLNRLTAQFVNRRRPDGSRPRVGDWYIDGKNAYLSSNRGGDNSLRYGMMGDPSLRLPGVDLRVCIDSIGGMAVSDDGAFPELPARGRVAVSGHIADLTGAEAADFNGTAALTLFDAERVVTTNGNGTAGTPVTYNDRKTKLYTGRVNVTGGRWQTTILMPAEIENNYSPGLLHIYAFDNTGREASGATESFYVYGYDESAPIDVEGPEISRFVLNGDSFADGGVVNPSPVVLAAFSDPSGINVSEAGLGHRLSLCLDGKTYYDDLASYYLPAADDITAGSLTYPLTGLDAGAHTLELTVWDNANNSSSASLTFNVDVAAAPTLYDVSTDVNPAKTSVVFNITTDRPMETLACRLDVIDLNGRVVWTRDSKSATGSDAAISFPWDLRDSSGVRVPRGIYLYRAVVETEKGAAATKTRKLAVAAE